MERHIVADLNRRPSSFWSLKFIDLLSGSRADSELSYLRARGNRMEILILEDDPSLRFAYAQMLEDCGHNIHKAGDIPTAVSLLNRITPDLLLLDLMIGSSTSILISDLAKYRAPDADIVYVTGSGRFPNGELLGLSCGASWVLRKPVDFVELKAMVAHLGRTAPRGKAARSIPA